MHENHVVHRPTGAWFTAYPGDPEIKGVNWGHAGDVLPTGEDYDRGEVQTVAPELLRARKGATAIR